MKIGLTYDLKSDWVWKDTDPKDANAELDKPQTVEEISAALESSGHEVIRIGGLKDLMRVIHELDVDLIFNICEGLAGRNRESQVPIILEMNGIPFIGADALSLGITLDKVIAKKCFVADGIPTPGFFVADMEDDLKALNHLSFPLIVKTRYEGTSKGLSDQSRVEDYEALKRQVDFINQTYHQPALVEEFISGREFTVAVIGNKDCEAMPVVQVSIDGNVELNDEFYTFERVTCDSLRYVCPAQISTELARRIKELAVRAYKSVDCRDFGRVDFRVDKKGDPFVLEINPLPALGSDDIFHIFPKIMGTTYEEIINRIVTCACDRYGLKQQNARGALTSSP